MWPYGTLLSLPRACVSHLLFCFKQNSQINRKHRAKFSGYKYLLMHSPFTQSSVNLHASLVAEHLHWLLAASQYSPVDEPSQEQIDPHWQAPFTLVSPGTLHDLLNEVSPTSFIMTLKKKVMHLGTSYIFKCIGKHHYVSECTYLLHTKRAFRCAISFSTFKQWAPSYTSIFIDINARVIASSNKFLTSLPVRLVERKRTRTTW